MKLNKILFSGAILGLLSVLMAAYVDHSVSLVRTGKSLDRVLIAIRYHQLYAIVITIMGLIFPLQTDRRIKSWLIKSAYFFISGILLFSFSIYISSITGIFALLHLVPIGGLIFMIGWVGLICVACLRMK